jgi:Flp pilus assembly protein TadG
MSMDRRNNVTSEQRPKQTGTLPPFWRQLWRSEDGGPALELGIVAPIFMILLAGVFGYGIVAFETMQVNAAAQAGAIYALTNGFNAAKIQTAVTSATGLPAITAPAPTQISCGCANGSSIAAATCGTSCSDGTDAGIYATVKAQYAVSPAVPGIPATLNASVTVRIQ